MNRRSNVFDGAAATTFTGDTTPATDLAAAIPHLVAAVLASVLFLSGLAVGSWYADRELARHIYALAGSRHRQKAVGLAVQREALRHDDLLPLYGSSDVDQVSSYHARELFADAPTGFSVLTVGRPGGLVFTVLESVGALGSDLRGKKVVVSLSPTMFQLQNGPTLTRRYAGNLFPLQMLTLLLNPDLSDDLRRRIATRLVARPSMLQRHGVLAQVAAIVARSSPLSRAEYYAFLPLALMELRLLELQDKIRELGHVLTTPLPRARQEPRTLDWPRLVDDATARFQVRASNNPFGVDDNWWEASRATFEEQRNGSSDQEFRREVEQAEAWLDLEQLLQVLKELQAQPLILSMPFHGPFLDYTGVSADARSYYYSRVRELAARYGVRALVLDDHEADPFFFRDLGSHLSPKGWIYYGQALDAFYHDALR